MHEHANTPKLQLLGSSDFTVVKRVYGHGDLVTIPNTDQQEKNSSSEASKTWEQQ